MYSNEILALGSREGSTENCVINVGLSLSTAMHIECPTFNNMDVCFPSQIQA